MKLLIFPCVFLLFFIPCTAQFSRHIVYLKHKGATTFTLANASAYLSQRAIDRRVKYGIAIDSADLPIPATYITQIKTVANVTVLNTSKWLNAITIQTSDANALATINAMSFVKNTSAIALRNTGGKNRNEEEVSSQIVSAKPQDTQADYFNYGTNSFNEIHLHKGEFLHNIGLRGQGMQISLLDGGFNSYTTLDAMDSMIINGQLLSTWDFVNREPSVSEDDPHGMQCLSTIVANIPGQFVGKAPKASFHLYKTEDAASEYPIEEFNWVCGAEKADSIGTDVISSSLGYNTFNDPSFDYTYSDMNGDTAISTKGADIAAQKGIMVFNAVGNYGTGPWKFLAAPADGDSVIAVGAVTAGGAVWPGSSYGPSFDGRIKPDVTSVGAGAMIQNTNNTIGTGNGTSFACPNMAGLGTCLWQGFPEFSNMRIARALREAAHKVSAPDDRVGYGIPDMKSAFGKLLTEYATSTATINSCTVTFRWNSKDVSAMKYEIERKAPGETNYSKIGDMDPAAGLILANHSYQFDNTITGSTTGTFSYRVRQIIDTAAANFTAIYIDTADIAIASPCTTTATNDIDANGIQFTVTPNPVNNSIAILILETRNAIPDLKIAVYNMKGQLIRQIQQSKAPGKAIIEIPVSQFAKGKYLISVFNSSKKIGSTELLKL